MLARPPFRTSIWNGIDIVLSGYNCVEKLGHVFVRLTHRQALTSMLQQPNNQTLQSRCASSHAVDYGFGAMTALSNSEWFDISTVAFRRPARSAI
jgi:hypothetical protein